ncbi:unnamed protein product [Gulo gulo]|uniref:Uncharacterized protein n=1 Tax=Gulo gulo TaxID=48420 RepID=A0A9X9M6M8_GULGU|nr:unnamed protein product [Gulo gulo]
MRCNHRAPFRNYGHNLGVKTPVPAGTPQPDPRQDTAVSSCGPHRNQGNAESWKIHYRGQTHCSQPKAREKFHLTLLQTRLQVMGFHRDRDQMHASPALLRTSPDMVLGPQTAQTMCLQKVIQMGQQDTLRIPVNPPPRK